MGILFWEKRTGRKHPAANMKANKPDRAVAHTCPPRPESWLLEPRSEPFDAHEGLPASGPLLRARSLKVVPLCELRRRWRRHLVDKVDGLVRVHDAKDQEEHGTSEGHCFAARVVNTGSVADGRPVGRKKKISGGFSAGGEGSPCLIEMC